MTEAIRKGSTEAPARIRVAQDADGFWTCREAVSGSQEYIRADIVEELRAALEAAKSEMEGHDDNAAYLIIKTALSRLAEVSK